MREIKFRALKDDMSNSNWVYGSLIYDCYGNPRIQESTETDLLFTTCFKDTEGQFTGFTDKNGKEIYEGDIFPSTSKGIKFYKLIFENGGFVLYHNYGYWGTIARFIEASEKFNFNLEIIGNINENPELIN